REVFSSRARDAWRIQRHCHVPVVAELPASLLSRVLPLSRDEALAQRRKAVSGERSALRFVAACREAICQLRKAGDENAILLLGAGARTANAVAALANIAALDAAGRSLVIDLNHRDPLPGSPTGAGLGAFFGGGVSW